MEPTSPRRTTYRIFCADCDDCNLANDGFPEPERRNVLGRMSDVRAIAFDHARLRLWASADTCSRQNFVVEVTRANGRTSESHYGIYDGRFVRVEV